MEQPKKLFVKPVNPAVEIKDPVSRIVLPSEGGEVPDNTFWRRRIDISKDVVEVKPPEAEKVDTDKTPVIAMPMAEEVTPLENKHRARKGSEQ